MVKECTAHHRTYNVYTHDMLLNLKVEMVSQQHIYIIIYNQLQVSVSTLQVCVCVQYHLLPDLYSTPM